VLDDAGTAARRRGSTSASASRVDQAENKVTRLTDQLADLEAEVETDVTEIGSKWDALAADVSSMTVSVERSDVNVTQLSLAWVPVG
jgi:hypothetical protein